MIAGLLSLSCLTQGSSTRLSEFAKNTFSLPFLSFAFVWVLAEHKMPEFIHEVGQGARDALWLATIGRFGQREQQPFEEKSAINKLGFLTGAATSFHLLATMLVEFRLLYMKNSWVADSIFIYCCVLKILEVMAWFANIGYPLAMVIDWIYSQAQNVLGHKPELALLSEVSLNQTLP